MHLVMRTLSSVATCAVVLVAGCTGEELGDPIVGRWEVAGDDVEIEFLADGTFEISGGTGAEQGRWERIEDGRIVLETTNFTGKDATPQVLRIEQLEDGEATVTVGAGEPARMRRVDPR